MVGAAQVYRYALPPQLRDVEVVAKWLRSQDQSWVGTLVTPGTSEISYRALVTGLFQRYSNANNNILMLAPEGRTSRGAPAAVIRACGLPDPAPLCYEPFEARVASLAMTIASQRGLSQPWIDNLVGRIFSPWSEGGLGIEPPRALLLGHSRAERFTAVNCAMSGAVLRNGRGLHSEGLDLLACFAMAMAAFATFSLSPRWVVRRKLGTDLSHSTPHFSLWSHDQIVLEAAGRIFPLDPETVVSEGWPLVRALEPQMGGVVYDRTNTAAFYHRIGHPGHAISSARDLVALDPEDLEGFFLLGLVLLHDKKYDDALEALTAAERLCPATYTGLQALIAYGRGVAHVAKQSYDSARASLRQALQHAPGMRAARELLTRIDRLTGPHPKRWRAWYAFRSIPLPAQD